MPTAPTIATAYKNILKNEIAGVKRNLRKMRNDFRKERQRLKMEAAKIARRSTSIDRIETRESAKFERRLGILQGRL